MGTSQDSSKAKGKGKSATAGMKPLPDDFEPGRFDVICARGKHIRDSVGNKWFRGLVASQMGQYNECTSKLEKSYVVSQIIKTVRQTSETGGGFVKQIGGSWYEVGDRHAREKIGQTLPDLLFDKYTSSTKAKAVVRRKRALEAATLEENEEEESDEEEGEENEAKNDKGEKSEGVANETEPVEPERATSQSEDDLRPELTSQSTPKKARMTVTPTKSVSTSIPPRASTWSDPRSMVHPLFRNGPPKLPTATFPAAMMPSCGSNNHGMAFPAVPPGFGACHRGQPAWNVQPGPSQFDFRAAFEQRVHFNRSLVHQPTIPSGSAVVGRYGYGPITPPLAPEVAAGCYTNDSADACSTPPTKMMRRAPSPDLFASRAFFDVDGEDDSSIMPLLDSLQDDIEPLPMETPVTSDCLTVVAKSWTETTTGTDTSHVLGM